MTAIGIGGKALVERLVADMAARGLKPDARENELLSIAAGLADQLRLLAADVKRNGTTVELESGRRVLNPAVGAHTRASAELARVLEKVSMSLGPQVNLARQKAAQTRWAAHNTAKANRGG